MIAHIAQKRRPETVLHTTLRPARDKIPKAKQMAFGITIYV